MPDRLLCPSTSLLHVCRYTAYAQSKLANVLMTAQLMRSLDARRSSMRAHAVSPGRVATHIFSNLPPLLRRPASWLAAAAFQVGGSA